VTTNLPWEPWERAYYHLDRHKACGMMPHYAVEAGDGRGRAGRWPSGQACYFLPTLGPMRAYFWETDP